MGILNGGWVSNTCSATTIGVLALIATPVVLVAVACGASVAPPVASEPTASIDITEVVANTRAAMEAVTSFRVQGRTEVSRSGQEWARTSSAEWVAPFSSHARYTDEATGHAWQIVKIDRRVFVSDPNEYGGAWQAFDIAKPKTPRTDESRVPPAEGVQVTETDDGFWIAWEFREEQGKGVRVDQKEWLVDPESFLVQRKTTETRIVTGGETIRARTQYDYSGFNEGIVVTPPAEFHEVSGSHPEAIFWPYGSDSGEDEAAPPPELPTTAMVVTPERTPARSGSRP